MSITLNTYGLRSIHAETFNADPSKGEDLPRPLRDFALTLLRINNLILNILGYIPGLCLISGCVRMGIGACIVLLTLSLGSPNAEKGLLIGRWFDEAIGTGVAQIARGALEAFVPAGRWINFSLDSLGTILNIRTESSHFMYLGGWEEEEIRAWEARPPYRDPNYPAFLFFLHLV